MNKLKRTSALALAAAAAALLSSCATMEDTGAKLKNMTTASVEGKCTGINSCKGKSACATATSSCAAQNSCKGKGWVKSSKSDCDTKGGSFEAMAKK